MSRTASKGDRQDLAQSIARGHARSEFLEVFGQLGSVRLGVLSSRLGVIPHSNNYLGNFPAPRICCDTAK